MPAVLSSRPANFQRSPAPNAAPNAARPALAPSRPGRRTFKKGPPPEAEILFQKFFKSVGPRTYAAQVKKAGNGNHFIVLTEGKRDEKTNEVKKTKLFIFSEDFDAMRDLLRDTFAFIKEHPVPADVRAKRAMHWKKAPRK
jgi:hypothetical protein